MAQGHQRYRPPVFRGVAGFHLVDVVEVITKAPGDAEHQTRVADLVLGGTNWQ